MNNSQYCPCYVKCTLYSVEGTLYSEYCTLNDVTICRIYIHGLYIPRCTLINLRLMSVCESEYSQERVCASVGVCESEYVRVCASVSVCVYGFARLSVCVCTLSERYLISVKRM